MNGLCKLLEADYWLWNIMRFQSSETPIAYDILHNMPEDMFSAFASLNYEHDEDEVTLAIIKNNAADRNHWTRKRTYLVSQDTFESSTSYTKYFSKTDLGDSLISNYPTSLENSIYSCCCVHRSRSKPAFNDRDCLIFHILISEVAWLHHFDIPNNDHRNESPLPPRLQTIFTLILEGYTPKRIALHLSITENTVRTYIKQIYKHFSVSGRIELTQRFTYGDGNHLPHI
ncbi:response regulator transcription factor [Planctomycetota bacterium]|nr:response regulator transcription factor [Planctomycetota bacterium]